MVFIDHFPEWKHTYKTKRTKWSLTYLQSSKCPEQWLCWPPSSRWPPPAKYHQLREYKGKSSHPPQLKEMSHLTARLFRTRSVQVEECQKVIDTRKEGSWPCTGIMRLPDRISLLLSTQQACVEPCMDAETTLGTENRIGTKTCALLELTSQRVRRPKQIKNKQMTNFIIRLLVVSPWGRKLTGRFHGVRRAGDLL